MIFGIKYKLTESLTKVPTIKPASDPRAIFSDLFISGSSILAPIKAPKNGPIIIPKGGKKKIPIIKPIGMPIRATVTTKVVYDTIENLPPNCKFWVSKN